MIQLRLVDSGAHQVCRLPTLNGGRYSVALTRCLEQGTGEAQNVARDLIEDLDPQWLLVVGIAGGVPASELTLGDVVVSTRILDFSVEAVIADHSRDASPEQLERPQDADARADVHGLAMTLVFALHGSALPYRAGRDPERFIDALDCSSGMKTLLKRSIATEPTERTPDIASFCLALSGLPEVSEQLATDVYRRHLASA